MAENRRYFLSILIKVTLTLVVILLLTLISFIAIVHQGSFGRLPTTEELAEIEHGQGSKVLDKNGEVLGRYFVLDRRSITYDQLPPHLVKALVATEDVRFLSHEGIDYRSLIRVLVRTILLRDRSGGGGSTLTMQLAKNLYPREDFSKKGLAIAKIREAFIAKRLEEVYTKSQIIALYLNTVSFPDNTFGIESAAQRFFSKSVKELDLLESATLVGTLKATTTYNPRSNPERSLQRRNTVLAQMAKYEVLSQEEFEQYMAKKIALKLKRNTASEGLAPYFRAQVKKTVRQWIQDNPKPDGTLYNLYADGLTIKTTLDAGVQRAAEAAMQKHMSGLQRAYERNWGKSAPWNNQSLIEEKIISTPAYRQLRRAGTSHLDALKQLRKPKTMTWFTWNGEEETQASSMDSVAHYLKLLNTGFLALDPSDGSVRAWIGGIDFEHFQYDHVSQAKRQVGSTFKPFVYTAAVESGIAPCDYFSAKAVTYENLDGWTPTNGEEDKYEGQNLSMQTALSRSINTVAVKVMEKTGTAAVIQLAQSLGVTSNLPEVPSLALGTADLSILELAGAYAAYVNEPRPVKPILITAIQDKEGNLIGRFDPKLPEPAFNQETQAVMQQMLKSVVDNGTGGRLRWKYQLDNDIAGKTGTTQSNRDGWFVGITPKLITVTWVGADDPRIHFKETSIGQGANSALPIFGLFYQALNKDIKYDHITKAKFPAASKETLDRLDCAATKEDGLLKRLFTNEDKEAFREYGKDSTEQRGFFKKLGKLFKKKEK